MTGERAWTAPELTPAVDAPDENERAVEDRRGAIDQTATTDAKPGQVPGIDTRMEGRSRLGTTSVEPAADDADNEEDLTPHG